MLECPFCGTLVLPTATSCPSCQIVYSELYSKAEERLWDKAVDKIIEELDDIAEADAADLVCQKCNSVLERPRARCSKCGFSASRDETEPRKVVQERKPPSTESELDEEAVCPVCDSVVGLHDPVCSHCGAEFLVDEDAFEEDEIGEEEPIYCPACNNEVDLDVSKCPHCGAEFDEGEDLGVPTPADEEAFESATEPPMLFEEGKAKPEDAKITTMVPLRRARDPRGLSNGTSAVNGVGIINGKSRTNGVHLTNGLGVTNGRDMINGTGLARGHMASRIRAPLGVRGLAVLIVIVVVISAFVYVSYSHKGSPYKVDGDFGEWDDEVMFTMTTASTTPETNVIEWSAATYHTQLHVYVRVEGQLMVGDSVQRLVVFIDADDERSTGYLIGETGADFMLDLLGWNETVMTSISYEFVSTQDPQDQLDWSRWRQMGSVPNRLSGDRIEAMANLPTQLDSSSRLILVSQDSEGIRSTSYPVLLGGGLLIVEQTPADEIVASDLITPSIQSELLKLRFSCQGEGGSIESITPDIIGLDAIEPIAPFSLEIRNEHTVSVVADSSHALPGQFVSATLKHTGISSSFQRVLITGAGAYAYCISPPESISVDGAFADWTNKTVKDIDDLPIANPNVDIDGIGVDRSTDNSYFYMSVYGDLCSGVYVPKDCAISTGAGGGTVVPVRKTAQDFTRIFIDSDQSEITGKSTIIGTQVIGADFMIEIGGVCGVICTKSVYSFSSGSWSELDVPIQAAKDTNRIEIGVVTSSIGSPVSMDFIIETTDWRDRGDQATNTTDYGIRRWVVDSSTTSQDATSMSYQRKLFYDGTNHWSFYFDGDDTVYKYSSDGGETWISGAAVFSTSGVEEVSIWYDSDNEVVYAVGDTAGSSTNVYIQKGEVSPGSHAITWEVSDSTLAVSTESIASKNAYICRDVNGYLWIVGTNQSQNNPDKYKFTAFRSSSANDITEWVYSGEMAPSGGINSDEIRGSIAPAGSGSHVWAIFIYDGYVYSKKYTGTWPGSATEIFAPKDGNHDNVIYAPPSVVVDSDGVVHVVYGDDTASGSVLLSHIWYTYNNTDSTSWATAVDLNESMPSNVGNRYPTISLDTSTGDLYAFWIRTTGSGVGQTIMGKKKSSGSWSALTISNPDTDPKNHLTSIYSVSGESLICWQWTQNTTGNIEVLFDVIPEFKDIVVPVLIMMAIFYIGFRRRRTPKSSGD
ncbi:MAG: hypothetical protein JSV94_05675 [Methanobacteriota archaeon]|nr:MAG: hypothetical protein JSV94_05675 [Euryarchaeota archaeon]